MIKKKKKYSSQFPGAQSDIIKFFLIPTIKKKEDFTIIAALIT